MRNRRYDDDVNSIILRKVVPNIFVDGIEGFGVIPIKIKF
jgi:hypothetical protein